MRRWRLQSPFCAARQRANTPTVIFLSRCECQSFSRQNPLGYQDRFGARSLGQIRYSSGHALADLPMGRIRARCGLSGTTEERLPSEQKWYALTGRVVDLKVEADGDIRLALQDASGNRVGTVSVEIPVGPNCCEIRGEKKLRYSSYSLSKEKVALGKSRRNLSWSLIFK